MTRRRSPRRTGTAALAALALAACSLRSGSRGADDRGPGPPVRIWAAPVLWWEAGAPREVGLGIENLSDRTVAIAAPDPANARIELFAGAEAIRVCGVEPDDTPVGTGRLELAPGDRVALRVSLSESCRAVPPGEYRYEVAYRVPPAGASHGGRGAAPGPPAFSGMLAPVHGQVVVVSDGEEPPGGRAAGRPAPRREARRAPLRGDGPAPAP